jgi:hypothetical protein
MGWNPKGRTDALWAASFPLPACTNAESLEGFRARVGFRNSQGFSSKSQRIGEGLLAIKAAGSNSHGFIVCFAETGS